MPTLLEAVISTGLAAGWWISQNVLFVGVGLAVLLIATVAVRDRLAKKAIAKRVRFTLTPTRRFDPVPEQLWRYAAVLLRASNCGPWWAPLRSKSVRLRLRADGTCALDWSVEGAASAHLLLAGTPYDDVTVTEAAPVRDKAREYTVRAEFTVGGSPAAALREVPLQPDPLQPIVDAVAALRADLGDLAEIVLDLQPVPHWRMRLRRWQLMAQARERARTAARRESRMQAVDAADLEESWAFQLGRLLDPNEGRTGSRRLAMPARPRPVSREQTLGRLGSDSGVVRIQLLVRCSSDTVGRAQAQLQQLTAALDVFAGPSRLRVDARRLGPWQVNADTAWRSKSFDRRWASGLVVPRGENWVGIGELVGLLKPPTTHCRMPVLASDVPTYELGSAELLPHGWHTAPDGTSRLIAGPVEESLFGVAVGKATYGKTERSLVQAIALAHGGHGCMFIDPHADTWKAAEAYLAHHSIRDRVQRLDLTNPGDTARVGGWNPLAMDKDPDPSKVADAVVDAFASVMGWSEITAPRALTIFIKCVEALVAVNAAAIAAKLPRSQATLFQIPALLQDPLWREAALRHLPAKAARWWTTTFTTYTEDAFSVVLNPLERLASDRVARALLGTPTGKWDIRKAMDTRRVVWVCPAGTGPTDRLLVSLLIQDLYRAGLSRKDLPVKRRRPFFVFLDELISLDGAASATIAEITEELRKFGIRLHAMTQLLQRISATTRDSLLQNASILSTTAGSNAAIKLITDEWHDAVDPALVAELPKYHHYVSLTVAGKRVGPLKIRGPQVKDVFRALRSKDQIPTLTRRSVGALGALPIAQRLAIADKQDQVVLRFLTHGGPPADDTGPCLAKSGPKRPNSPTDAAARADSDATPSRHQ
ncbi:type IV secretory system conjugative DNA transfer family protein [Streptacidiphilus sp. EB129]|uniref:type IV secretory system conjugative DNA transfer family protein n=1 Tax=Streptacidiphilus sp. EB129 TaxID=3156262 RepID=UPI0035158828